jgi:hypothetical protein
VNARKLPANANRSFDRPSQVLAEPACRVSPRVRAIAAGEHDHHGGLRCALGGAHDDAVSLQHAGFADEPVAESVVVGWIRAGDHEDELRRHGRRHRGERALKRVEVAVVGFLRFP